MEKLSRSVCKFFAAICWAVLLAAGSSSCKGSPGAAGPARLGAPDQGTIRGLLNITGTSTPAIGVKVVANPGNFATASNNDGRYELQVPVGVYALTFGAGINNDGFDPITISNVVVVGGGSNTVNASVVQLNPLSVTATSALQTGGIHNPTYVYQILANTQAQLNL